VTSQPKSGPPCLKRSFYEDNTENVAKSLLGKILVRRLISNGRIVRLSGYIEETEAYGYRDDPASHAFNGVNIRNSVMFGDVGHLYVYFTYGKHFCVNVTAKVKHTEAGAVLIRSIMPIKGVETMRKLRNNSKNLTLGPGRVAEALAITKDHNGLDITLDSSEISVHEGLHIREMIITRRVGISKGVDKPWRFLAAQMRNKHVRLCFNVE
jgi:DNA-3-methyladenine glycosylase